MKLKAYMDQFLRFREDIERATGLIAIYCFDDLPPPVLSAVDFNQVGLSLVESAKYIIGWVP